MKFLMLAASMCMLAAAALAQPRPPFPNRTNVAPFLGSTASTAGFPGIDRTGATDSTAGIQSFLNIGGNLTVRAGTYSQNAPLNVASATSIECEPGATFKAASSYSATPHLIQNVNNAASSLTDHDISIYGCTFDMSLHPAPGGGNFQAIYFRKVQRAYIRANVCTGGGDCTAMLASDSTWISENYASHMGNACWDHWDHPANLYVLNNWCSSYGWGVLVTGGDTLGATDGLSTGGLVAGNYIRVSGGLGPAALAGGWFAGIWHQGGLPGPSTGVSRVKYRDNVVDLGSSAFTASIAGTSLTVTGAVTGTPLDLGNVLIGAGVTPATGATPTFITAFGTGTGGSGTYTVSQSQTVSSESMTSASPNNCAKVSGAGSDITFDNLQCYGGIRGAISTGSDAGGTPTGVAFRDTLIDGVTVASAAPLISIGTDNSTVSRTRALSASGYTYAVAVTAAHDKILDNDIPAGTTGAFSFTGATDFTVRDAATYAWTPSLLTGASATGLPLTTAAGSVKWLGKAVNLCGNLALGTKGSPVAGAMTIGGLATGLGISSSNASAFAHGQLMNTVYTANLTGAPVLPIVVKTIPNTGGFAVASQIDIGTAAALTDTNVSTGFSLAFCGLVDFQ